jgi:ferric-dicitrate binding protein FerR (iron transport regulator)
MRLWHKIAIAVSIILVASTILILNHYARNGHYQELNAKNDIPAGGNKAYITFSSGKRIKLSSQKNGVVINTDALTYNDGTDIAANASGSITLSTPMGGTYQVMLPDGTKCWLNAASSIQFPSTFSNSVQRRVILSGEAYFEVSKDKQHPFIVKSNGQDVEVLGTHFDISSYAGEHTRTTLLEGSVQVNNNIIIKPGEQATGSGLNITVRQADIQANVAWKNGDFIFNDEPLENIMRLVSRWYNVDVIYAEGAPKGLTMSGIVSRSRPISAVLERMQGTGKVNFKIDGRQIYVLP